MSKLVVSKISAVQKSNHNIIERQEDIMNVTMSGNTICVKMPVNETLMAFYYKRVGQDWVKYKRQPVLTVH